MTLCTADVSHAEKNLTFLCAPPCPILQSYIVAMIAARGGDTTPKNESLSDTATSSKQSVHARSQQPIADSNDDAINHFLEKFLMEPAFRQQEKRFKLVLQSTNSDQHCLWNALREAMIDAGMRAFDYIQIRKEILNAVDAWDIKTVGADSSILQFLITYKEVGPPKQMESSEPCYPSPVIARVFRLLFEN